MFDISVIGCVLVDRDHNINLPVPKLGKIYIYREREVALLTGVSLGQVIK